MKRAAIITMTVFYLLLTTGMFVCIVHCGAQSLLEKPSIAMAHTGMAGHGSKKHCDGDKDCGCCKKHGAYVIKENLKPGSELQFAQIGYCAGLPVTAYYSFNISYISNTTRVNGKAPPGKTGKLISIQFCSLQI